MIPETGFKKERSTIDDIFVLNHLMQQERQGEKREKVYMLFANLKMAFDNVKREEKIKKKKNREIDKKNGEDIRINRDDKDESKLYSSVQKFMIF